MNTVVVVSLISAIFVIAVFASSYSNTYNTVGISDAAGISDDQPPSGFELTPPPEIIIGPGEARKVAVMISNRYLEATVPFYYDSFAYHAVAKVTGATILASRWTQERADDKLLVDLRNFKWEVTGDREVQVTVVLQQQNSEKVFKTLKDTLDSNWNLISFEYKDGTVQVFVNGQPINTRLVSGNSKRKGILRNNNEPTLPLRINAYYSDRVVTGSSYTELATFCFHEGLVDRETVLPELVKNPMTVPEDLRKKMKLVYLLGEAPDNNDFVYDRTDSEVNLDVKEASGPVTFSNPPLYKNLNE